MPLRRAPTQPRPAQSRVTNETMPVIVNVEVCGAEIPMSPSGLSAVFTMPGNVSLSDSAMVARMSGRPWRKKANAVNASASAGKIEKKAK
jgi:hypothetical protein